jgi:hypothetical protein
MPLTESMVPPMREAALTWFGELVPQAREVGHGPHAGGTLTRPLPAEEEASEAIQQLNPAIPGEASACAAHADRRATGKRF